MPDPDDADDAMDSLSWPDTSRPIISNSMPTPAPSTWPTSPPARYLPRRAQRRRRRWPALVVGVLVVAVLVLLLVIWLR